MHHRAPVAKDIDGDAAVPAAVPAVGAEVAFFAHSQVAAQEDVAAAIQRRDGPPPDVELLRLTEVALGGCVAAVAVPGRGRREREVAAVGGAKEEDVGDAFARDPVHLPRRVQRRAVRAEGDAGPVLVGVDVVPAPRAAPQPHVRPIGEAVHRGRGCWTRGGGDGVAAVRYGGRVDWRCCVARRRREGGRGEKSSRAEQVLFATGRLAWAHFKASTAQVGCCIARQLAGGARAANTLVCACRAGHDSEEGPPNADRSSFLRDYARPHCWVLCDLRDHAAFRRTGVAQASSAAS